MNLNSGDLVFHSERGNGSVLMVDGPTAVVRFDSGLQQVLLTELTPRSTVTQALSRGQVDRPAEAQLHLQAELITSLNDTWGVFSRSRISLLPHQLWVCHRVLSKNPPRWLIADDVGLGKTVEAGLILWPLLARRQVTRLLILAPASLTQQWRDRMFNMFDIRLTVYDPQQDRPTNHGGANYWHVHQQVIASLQTLRDDRKGRHERLLDGAPWDLVIVDEAHHLNVDERSGSTLGYDLIEKLNQAGKIKGLILFTATPHRGKDYGFLSLLELLDPDRFSREQPIGQQLRDLPTVMIRNNKQNATDLQGERLFQTPVVESEKYEYSPAEAEFYSKMTEFIATGQAYAATLGGGRNTQAVKLVLISLQKLASSSVAAVRRALRKRLQRVTTLLGAPGQILPDFQPDEGDAESAFIENIGDWFGGLALMENEKEKLQELIDLAERIEEETKVQKIMELLEGPFLDRTVLFFTEYKATQSLLMSALIQRYGEKAVGFINGDGRAEGVLGKTLTTSREAAAQAFNDGEIRFLVSTEAAGEGIDLQRNCHTLIHVDLPWNPMRLHQRVGRLNRYGQKHQVHVVSLRNPATIEGMIWDLLNSKIEKIKRAFDAVMPEREDLLQLVLGMTSPHLFDEVFAEAPNVGEEDLNSWFDQKTAQFGGHDVLETVRNLVGHSSRFDYQQASALIPKVDLPDLLPFFRSAVRFNHRQIGEKDGLVSFKTPEAWQEEIGVRSNYQDLAFNRDGSGSDVAGVGHKVVDAALEQARHFPGNVAVSRWQGLSAPLYVFRVTEKVSTINGTRRTFIGRLMGSTPIWLRDWELLQRLNGVRPQSHETAVPPEVTQALLRTLNDELANLDTFLPTLNLEYAAPEIEPYAVFAPLPDVNNPLSPHTNSD